MAENKAQSRRRATEVIPQNLREERFRPTTFDWKAFSIHRIPS